MIVYKITNNIDGKFYIGITIRDFKKRIAGHIHSAKNGSEYALPRALRKYGPENFTFEVIDSDATSIEHLKQLEIWYIENLKPEYNLTKGGDGLFGYIWSEESKLKNSLSQKGRKLSEEHKRKISIGLTGKKQSKETITKRVLKCVSKKINGKKISESLNKRFNTPMFLVNGEIGTLNYFCKKYNKKISTVRNRVFRSSIPLDKALFLNKSQGKKFP